MDTHHLRALLEGVRRGDVGVDAALARLRDLPYEALDFARLDHHRALRNGVPEVVLALGKTPDQVAELLQRLRARHGRALATRADPAHWAQVRARLAEARYHAEARVIVVGERPPPAADRPEVVVCCAGTGDIPVAEEAALTAEFAGSRVVRLYDVGVAGLHRLLEHRHRLYAAGAIVAVAGMEGALPSVVAGLAGRPTVAVPTSVGYGASFGGVAALLAMLNSCAAGVAVVNIDNGFGAGFLAHLIAGTAAQAAPAPAAAPAGVSD